MVNHRAISANTFRISEAERAKRQREKEDIENIEFTQSAVNPRPRSNRRRWAYLGECSDEIEESTLTQDRDLDQSRSRRNLMPDITRDSPEIKIKMPTETPEITTASTEIPPEISRRPMLIGRRESVTENDDDEMLFDRLSEDDDMVIESEMIESATAPLTAEYLDTFEKTELVDALREGGYTLLLKKLWLTEEKARSSIKGWPFDQFNRDAWISAGHEGKEKDYYNTKRDRLGQRPGDHEWRSVTGRITLRMAESESEPSMSA